MSFVSITEIDVRVGFLAVVINTKAANEGIQVEICRMNEEATNYRKRVALDREIGVPNICCSKY